LNISLEKTEELKESKELKKAVYDHALKIIKRQYFFENLLQETTSNQYEYAKMCWNGEGGGENLGEFRRSLKLSINKGSPDVQYMYARMCYNGREGNEDLSEARKYFKMVSDSSEQIIQHKAPKYRKSSQYKYARMCYLGEGGDIDKEEAKRLFRVLRIHIDLI
jgi:TPR repeat protein